MKKIKIAIAIIIIIAIILVILILNIKGKNTNKDIILNNSIDKADEYKNSLEDAIDYTIETVITNKLESIAINKEYITIERLFKSFIENSKEENKEYLMNILAKSYIEEYNVTNENVLEKIDIRGNLDKFQYYKIIVTDMVKCNLDSNYTAYLVSGKYRITDQNGTYDLKLLIIINSADRIYSIYPEKYIEDHQYKNLRLGDSFKLNNYKVEKNKDNNFRYIIKDDLEITERYFKDYKELLQYYPTVAYQKLNNEYSKKKFNNQKEFFNYLENNKLIIGSSTIKEYRLEKNSNYVDYICIDQYNNIYIFRITGGDVTNYEVFLDDYTIMPDYEIKIYNSLEDYQKAKENVKKFENMINNRDYLAIYSVLDNTFKTNHYKNIEDFKNYIENNIYKINAIEIVDFDMDDVEYYVYECELQNRENNTEKKNMIIIIKLEEGTDFTMSFSFN